MNDNPEELLSAAWARVDARLHSLQQRSRERGDIPLYRIDEGGPAAEAELTALRAVLRVPLSFDLEYSLTRWNGRWIAHDHKIWLSPVSDYLYIYKVSARAAHEAADPPFESVRGPVNPIADCRRRVAFGHHESSGTTLYLDYEDPPAGGAMGQVIRIGEEPIAEFVAPSFVEFLNIVAQAPAYDDDPDYDPLRLA